MSTGSNLVAETAERLFAATSTVAVAHAAEAGTWPAALWQAIDDAGFTAALEPDSGVSLGEALAIVRAAGRHAAPVPFAETMLARALLTQAGLVPPDGGPLSIAVPLSGDGLRMSSSRLSGIARLVPFARDAGRIVALARGDAGDMVLHVPTAHAELRFGRNLAGEPRDDLTFNDTIVAPEAVAQAPGADGNWLLGMGALLRAAQMVGALEQVLESSVGYANERVQFGRPIGRFQAIQHQLAVVGGEVAASAAALDRACEAVTLSHPDRLLAIGAAKSRASEAAGIVASIAHQVHGAIGFTREFSLQRLTRRLWSWRDEFGAEAYWNERLGSALLDAGALPVWPRLAAL